MTKVGNPIRVLELRSVRGTGGGPEKTILAGAARTNGARAAVTICYLRDERDSVFAIDGRAADLGVEYVEIRERHSFDPSIWRPLVDIVRGRAIDIVHAHDYKTDFIALTLARVTGAIPLSTVHGWIHDSWRERRIYTPADRWLLRRYPRVIAVSDVIRTTLVSCGVKAERITTLLNGIDPLRFRRTPAQVADARRELGLEPGQLAIGAVGRLEPVKRFDVLLEAVARLPQQGQRPRVFVVGDGSLRAPLTALATKLGVDASFLGHRADIVRFHHAFDVFVQSSDSEGTPNAVLEAMALETPIVATSAGGTRGILTDDLHGLIVPCGDAGALAGAIARTLDDHDGALARATCARARVERELSFDERTRRLESLYEELAAARRDRGARPRTFDSFLRAGNSLRANTKRG
jgi:glycosyltransferase involved in cell wall biosynthesis